MSLLCVEAIATRELLEEAAAASAQSFGGAAPAGAPLASQAPSIAAAAALAPSPEPANSMSATPGAAPASSALPAPVQAPSTAESADAPTQAQAPTAEVKFADPEHPCLRCTASVQNVYILLHLQTISKLTYMCAIWHFTVMQMQCTTSRPNDLHSCQFTSHIRSTCNACIALAHLKW